MTCNGVVVWSSLQPWKHSLVDRGLQVVQSFLPLGVDTTHAWRRGIESGGQRNEKLDTKEKGKKVHIHREDTKETRGLF